MKILHVIQTLDPASGGPPVVATRLAAAQGARGHEVHLVSYSEPDREDAVERSLEGLPARDRIHLHQIGSCSKAESLFGSRMHGTLKDLIPGMDFVHGHSVWRTISRKAGAVAAHAGVPFTICIHGMLDPWCMSQKRLKKRIALALGYRSMLTKCSFIHCLNEAEHGFVEAFNFGTPLEVIPNGVFVDEFEPPPERGRFRAAHPEIGDKPYVFFLSRLHYKKGLDFLADAFARIAQDHPDAMLVVAGPDGGAQADFERRISDAGLTDRTVLTGPIYGPAKLEALVDSTCFCLPSRQEGFSIAITEALALGVPAVVTDACHYPEVGEVGAGAETELNTESIAQGMSRVLGASESDRLEMGRRGASLVRERFTWPVIAERTESLYQRYGAGGR